MARSGGLTSGASVIKSVQRGTFSAAMGGGNYYSVALSVVNPAKCSVTVFGSENSASIRIPYVYGLLSNALRIDGSAQYTGSLMVGSWEVVEYV